MREYSSFRDPSGFVFYKDGVLYRQINKCYSTEYIRLTESGLYDELVSGNLLVAHRIAELETDDPDSFCVICPERARFISYPYEWSFGQLKDAALTTLKIQRRAIDYGMILKDASAYNIQFFDGTPKLIDTLSFDFYNEGSPWIAYGQFCRHFLAPLFLAAEVDIRLTQLLRVYIDGIPLDLASKLLKGRGGFGAGQHIRWHARSISAHAEDGKKSAGLKAPKVSKFNYIALIESLIRIVERLSLKGVKTEWMNYYSDTNYTDNALKDKENIVARFVEDKRFSDIWDLGANDGRFSRIALEHGASFSVAFDIDPIAVERNYNYVKAGRLHILPLILDLTNPSPGIGFANRERMPIDTRRRPDCILALALIHHLAISNNLPFEKISEWFAQLSDNLIIEFVPKEDSQVQTLLATREDIFSNYSRTGFETAFMADFNLLKSEKVSESGRTIYLFEKKKESRDA